MKPSARLLTSALVAATICALFAGVACTPDPKDPETWIKALSDPSKAADAIEQLGKLITDAKDDAARADLQDRATDALIEAYKGGTNREAIVRLLARWKPEEAAEVFVDAVTNWKEGITDEMAKSAADAAGTMKLKEAVPGLIATLKADSMTLRLASVRALGDIGTPDVVDPLIARMLDDNNTPGEPHYQDFFVNRVAAEKLGRVGDPRAARSLMQALFMRARGANLFPFAAPSLVRFGPKVTNPLLIEMIEGKNLEVNALAVKLAFNQLSMNEKAYEIMGLFFEADDETRAFLMKSMETDDVKSHRRLYASEALGRIGGAGVKEILLKYLADPKTDVLTKLQIQKGLYLLADPSVLPALLEQCGPKGMVKDLSGAPSPILRIGAFEVVALLGRKADLEAAKKIIEDAKAEVEKEVFPEEARGAMEKSMAGHEVVLECDADAACYAGKLKDANEAIVRVAAWHLGVLGSKDKMKDLLAAVDTAGADSRPAVTWAINRLHGDGADPDKVWYAIQRDESLKRTFKKEEVYRDSMITYWNLRRWSAK